MQWRVEMDRETFFFLFLGMSIFDIPVCLLCIKTYLRYSDILLKWLKIRLRCCFRIVWATRSGPGRMNDDDDQLNF